MHVARVGGGAEVLAHAGPLAFRTTVRESTTVVRTALSQELDAHAAGRLEATLPLVRADFAENAAWTHLLEPHAEVLGFAFRGGDSFAARTGALGASLTESGRLGALGVAATGLRSSWGQVLGRGGAVLDAGGGVVYGPGELAFSHRPHVIGRWRAGWTGHVPWIRQFHLSTEGAWVGVRGAADHVTILHAGLGSRESTHVELGLAGAGASTPPMLARLLGSARAEEPSGGWLATKGWTGRAACGARLFETIEVGAAVDGDIDARELLGIRGTAAYVHPCRCLRVEGFAAQRLGRSGVDLWLSVDLAPR